MQIIIICRLFTLFCLHHFSILMMNVAESVLESQLNSQSHKVCGCANDLVISFEFDDLLNVKIQLRHEA